jgi:hypothetical protein
VEAGRLKTNLGASIGTARAGGVLLSALTTTFLGGIQNNPGIHGCFKIVLGPWLAVPGLPGRDVVSRSGSGSADLIMK